MEKNLHQWRHLGDEGLWREKRLIWDVKTPSASELMGEQEAAKEEADLGKEMIEKHLGKSKEEAEDSLGNVLDVHKGAIKDYVDSWNNILGGRLSRGIASFVTRGLIYDKNKAALNSELTKVATDEAHKRAQEVFDDSKEAKEHASNSLNILGHKIEAAGRLINNLDNEIALVQQKLDAANEANKGFLSLRRAWTGARNFLEAPLKSDNLQGRLQRLKGMRQTTESIRGDAEAKLGVKEQKNDKIREWDSKVISIVSLAVKDDPEKMNEFHRRLKEAVLGTRIHTNLLKHFIKKLNLDPTSQRAFYNAFSFLQNGNHRKWVPGSERISKFGDMIGAVSKADVQHYFRTKSYDVAKVNVGNPKIEDKIKFLKEARAGQEVKIGNISFIMIRKDANGFLMKEKGNDTMAYMNTKDAQKPLFTFQTEDGYSRMKLRTPDKSDSTHTVDFSATLVKKISATEDKKESNADKKKKAAEKISAAIQQAVG